MATLTGEGNLFHDTGEPNTTYFYKIRAVEQYRAIKLLSKSKPE